MVPTRCRPFALAVLLCLAAAPPPAAAASADAPDLVRRVLDALPWRNIGPAIMGGRIDELAVVESDPDTVYVATASGGLFKTTNAGVTWEPLFDDEPVSSIGAVAVAPSDPSIVWVGTGEPANRQSSSWGNGVYVSTDGGRSWVHRGLEDTRHIGRIRIDPRDADTVYVAALGHLWGPNEERGLFKTTDGGRSWKKVLSVDEDTGCVDVAMDPESPGILYAAMYQRRRTAFGFAGGGPGSGLYRSTDGGAHWTKLSRGLPSGDTGRIGIDVYRADPRIVYAIVENKDGGVFRSEDRGESWTKMSDTNPRPMYYSQIRIDPQNDMRIWVLGARMYYSEDGGRTFTTDRVTRIHGDHHALWIDPEDSRRMILGSDGGIHFSYDRGLTWDFVNTIPLGQFYEIGLDDEPLYRVYGGLQDNGSWRGPSRTRYEQGISNEDWIRVGGGDGFYTQPDPTDASIVYVESQNGNLSRLHLDRLERKAIRPEPPPGEEPYRFDWNSPLLVSPHDPRTIYYGGNRLFISSDRGDTWTRTEDLTKRLDRDEMPIMGRLVTEETLSRHDGIASYGQIITIAESPLRRGLLYVGTDDGNLQVSRDGGKTWTNVADRLPGVPERTYVSRVVASSHAEGRVYATLDGHRSDDLGTYAFVSEDYGESWKRITEGIPAGHTLNVIREHHRNENLLFAGGELGAYASFDRGGRWYPLGGTLPRVPVDDIAIHPRENDLVLGTHGRSIFILDDLTPLERLAELDASTELHLFPIRPAVSYRIYRHKGNTGHKFFAAPNPPPGALLYYYVGGTPEEGATLRFVVRDGAGETVRSWTEPAAAGLGRTNWDLRHDPPIADEDTSGFAAPPPGPRALPGEYTVSVAYGETEVRQSVRVADDPAVVATEADRRAQFETLSELGGLLARMHAAHERAAALRDGLERLAADLEKREATPSALAEALAAARERIERVERLLSRTEGRRSFGGAPPPLFVRLTRLYRAIDGFTEAPGADRRALVAAYRSELDERVAELDAAVAEEVATVNRLVRELGIDVVGDGS